MDSDTAFQPESQTHVPLQRFFLTLQINVFTRNGQAALPPDRHRPRQRHSRSAAPASAASHSSWRPTTALQPEKPPRRAAPQGRQGRRRNPAPLSAEERPPPPGPAPRQPWGHRARARAAPLPAAGREAGEPAGACRWWIPGACGRRKEGCPTRTCQLGAGSRFFPRPGRKPATKELKFK